MFTKLGVSVPTSHHILTRSQLVQCIVLSPALETDTKSIYHHQAHYSNISSLVIHLQLLLKEIVFPDGTISVSWLMIRFDESVLRMALSVVFPCIGAL